MGLDRTRRSLHFALLFRYLGFCAAAAQSWTSRPCSLISRIRASTSGIYCGPCLICSSSCPSLYCVFLWAYRSLRSSCGAGSSDLFTTFRLLAWGDARTLSSTWSLTPISPLFSSWKWRLFASDSLFLNSSLSARFPLIIFRSIAVRDSSCSIANWSLPCSECFPLELSLTNFSILHFPSSVCCSLSPTHCIYSSWWSLSTFQDCCVPHLSCSRYC